MRVLLQISQLVCIVVLACTVQACAASAEDQAANPIVAKVRTALNENPSVVSSNYRVTASGTEVHLSGVAPNSLEQQQVLETARKVPGVTKVVDETALDTMGQPAR